MVGGPNYYGARSSVGEPGSLTRYLPDIDVHAPAAKKFHRFQKIKFPPYSDIFGGCDVVDCRRVRNFNTKEGSFDAYRTNCAADRGHPAQALWRHRAGGVLADGRADRARPRRDAVC